MDSLVFRDSRAERGGRTRPAVVKHRRGRCARAHPPAARSHAEGDASPRAANRPDETARVVARLAAVDAPLVTDVENRADGRNDRIVGLPRVRDDSDPGDHATGGTECGAAADTTRPPRTGWR